MNRIEKLFAKTRLLIVPGYKLRMINILVTNFHQPQSTLLLLVAAIAGTGWKKLYEYALANQFRFLSYGDGCLIYADD
jgi:S-adenosylmethionine:tRNA ribosyltransferase-isomerase